MSKSDDLGDIVNEMDLLIREAHAVMKDLRASMKEALTVAQRVRTETKNDMREMIQTTIRIELEALAPSIRHSIEDTLDAAVAHTLQEFRTMDSAVREAYDLAMARVMTDEFARADRKGIGNLLMRTMEQEANRADNTLNRARRALRESKRDLTTAEIRVTETVEVGRMPEPEDG